MTASEAQEALPAPSKVTKRIVSRSHLSTFLASSTHDAVINFIEELNASVLGVKLTDHVPTSPVVEKLLDILEEVEKAIQETPPTENGNSRFGNPAFRTFYDLIASRATELHQRIPGLENNTTRANELAVYFCESWGNRQRIDYGSGMELNFLCWLLCLMKLDILRPEDDTALVIHVFWRYMKVCRLLQTTYWLEPAGSHGAQGLDDYHFAVFIFGSSQLANHKYLRPKAIHDNDVLEEFAKDYMYLSYVRYINSIKTESLRWHSPMLDDISGVKTWSKINSGMIKMYRAEVLAKLPVAQHFLFSSLLPFPDDPNTGAPEGEGGKEEEHQEEADVHVDETGHLHVRGEGFGDCCGIKIPSPFAAREEKDRAVGEGRVRRIPFD